MIIRLSECPSQPWKNGLGRTREIAVQPSGAGLDDFTWRVSIAEVDSGAPFSAFPGIERTIVLLDGDGFTMTLDEGRTHALTTPLEPFAFAGESGVTVALAGGPTRDFNLMVRRERAGGEVQAWHGPVTCPPDAHVALVFCARGVVDTVDGRLQAGDAWLPPSQCTGPVTLHEGTRALVVRIAPHAA